MNGESMNLGDRLGDKPGVDAAVDLFLEWAADLNLELYPHQEEALLAVASGDHVIVNTPIGSGKSLIAARW